MKSYQHRCLILSITFSLSTLLSSPLVTKVTAVAEMAVTLLGEKNEGVALETNWRNNPSVDLLSGRAALPVFAVGARPEPVMALAMAGLTFTVNSTADPGSGVCDSTECTLREAIAAANAAAGSDTIDFNIPGAGPHTITPLTPLPAISSPVVIDGYTQPGASANTMAANDDAVLMIELNGSLAGALNLLSITAGNSTIRGLVINRCARAIEMDTNGGNTIEGNFIGTNIAGNATVGLGNDYGVLISTGSSNNVIGGTTPAARNLISGNNFGVALQGGPSMVQGNFIGTDRAGATDLGNTIGVSVTASNGNTIGGTAAGARNVISGNGNGIRIQANNNVIQGNYIGINATGGAFSDTNTIGVVLFGSGNTIGGITPAARNVISGHSIGISLNADSTTVQGNYIGTDAAGATALGNTTRGISMTESNNTMIGGTAPGAGNLISANGIGIELSPSTTGINIQIQGNLIGTDVNGTADLGNTGDGVSFNDAAARAGTNISIGGTAAGAGNVISGNDGDGIDLRTVTGVTVQGNLIGTQINGTGALGNSGHGLNIVGAANNAIGGTAPGAGNRIAFNGAGLNSGGGVIIEGSTNTNNNPVRGNVIFANTSNGTITNRGLGIDLSLSGSGDGVTPNDACDGDTGPNNLQNFPVMTSAITSGGSTTIQGTLESTAATTFTIDLYSSSSADPSAHGEGESYLGSTTATPGGGCSYTFSFTTSSPVTTGQVVTATATDPSGNTSEFSNTRQVLSPTAAVSSISGHVTTNEAPLGGVLMTLTGGNALRRTITNSQGFYQFLNVATDSFCSVSPMGANNDFAPAARSFSLLANKTDADFLAQALPQTANPLDSPGFFVRQQYLDFLGREPDQGGFDYWSDQINRCDGDARCIHACRIGVSGAFFVEQEFQQTGSFIYALYKAGLGRQPVFPEFAVDRQKVVGGPELEKQKSAFVEAFVQRAKFLERYQANTTAEAFVDALLRTVQQSAALDLSAQRAHLISKYHTGGNLSRSRSLVLRHVAETPAFKEAEYNAAFVLTEYFGYLRRDPEPEGYAFWLDVLNNRDPGNYRGMICSFVTSTEYQRRFSSVVSQSNSECAQ